MKHGMQLYLTLKQSYSITNNLEVERSALTYTNTVRFLRGLSLRYALWGHS